MNHKLSKHIQRNIFGHCDIIYIAVYKKEQVIKLIFYNITEGALIPIQVPAVATCAVIHVGSSFCRRDLNRPLHLLYEQKP